MQVSQSSPDLQTIFQSLQTPYIVFDIDDPVFTILEENEAHARIAMVKQENVVGKPLLEAFPDTSEAYQHSGKSELLESIRTVIKTGKPDSMPNLKYDLRDARGNFTPKYWSVTHHPVSDTTGKIVAVYQDTRDITEEILIEQKLDRTQQQLDQVLASSLIGVWYWDLEQSKIVTDENLAHMFGINPETAMKGLPIDVFIKSMHPDDQTRVQQSIHRTLRNGSLFEEEYRTRVSKDEVRWVIARGSVKYEDNVPQVFSGVIIDITDRKRAEKEVVASEKRLRFLTDTMPQLIWITRSDGYHEYYNQQWYDYTGTSPGETDGEGWNNLFHPDDRARAAKAWRASLRTGKPYEIEYRLYHAPSGAYRWTIGRAIPFRDDTGKILKWYGTCTDIHEQKHAAEIQAFLAKVSKELSTTLDYKKMLKQVTKLCVPVVADWCSIDLYNEEKGFEQVSVAHTDPKQVKLAYEYRARNPISIDDPTGVSNVLRTGKAEYYPYLSEELLEQYIEDEQTLAFMKSLNLHSIIIAPISISNRPVGGISFIVSDSGRYFTEDDLRMVEELAARISLAMTNSKLYADSLADLKKRRRLEKELLLEKEKLETRVRERTKQLQQQSEDLARSNAELEDFAYVASHDLQEPLRKIQAFSNLLISEYQQQLGDGAHYVERMDAAALRMSTLIQDLLAFSRVTTKQNEPASVDLTQIAEEVVQDLETRLEEVKGSVKIKSLPVVVADPTHMRQLLQNLIGNGLKFHKPGVAPIVHVSAKTSGARYVEILVRDNGIGFDEKYLDRIFSVFQRLHGRDAYDGTGIGLAVCRKIVERYGGTITAESKKNEGATFIVRLPKLKEAKA